MMLNIFDMGGVLPEAARRMGLSESVTRRFALSDMDALMTGSMSLEDYWRGFEAASAEQLGISSHLSKGIEGLESIFSSLPAPELKA